MTGGVNVATALYSGDTAPDIVTGPGPGIPSQIRVFRNGEIIIGGSGEQQIASFDAFDPAFLGGVHVG
jgi:hypothetical protein